MTTRALIIDDEPDIRELLELTLMRMGIDTATAATYKDAISKLSNENFDVCLTDMKLPDGNGIELVRHIQQHHKNMPVAVFTAHGNMDLAIEALKAGAFDFISKPVALDKLRNLITTAVTLSSQTESTPNIAPPTGLLGDSGAMLRLRNQITKVSRSQAPVFISGESGTGKELTARAIHYQSARAQGPFIPVNCGAIPRDLMESEFFGHKKGSFTGASADKEGLFVAANGGTLFLDEVADLPLDMQVKLLRAIQEKAVRPVGAEKEITVDVRILSATHKDLEQEIRQERFRNDLFYRINVIQISLPPLRERRDDIPLLADAILTKLAEEIQLPVAALTPAAIRRLQEYNFPGNIRELENILERAYTLCEEDTIDSDDLQLNSNATDLDDNLHHHPTENVEDIDSLDDYLADIERDVLISTLEKTRWNRTEAAKKLGLTFRSLRYRLKKLGLDE